MFYFNTVSDMLAESVIHPDITNGIAEISLIKVYSEWLSVDDVCMFSVQYTL